MVSKMMICRQKKKSISIWLLCAFCFAVLWGCGSGTQIDNITEATETVETIEIVETTETEEINKKKVLGWFLLLAESLEGAS